MKQFRPALVLIVLAGIGPLTLSAQPTKSLPGNPSEPITEERMSYLVTLCEGCHGEGGVSQRQDVPTLANRDSDELFAEIERFYFYERRCPDVPMDEADAARGHMSMCDITSQINKQEGEALAEYFEAQTPGD